MTQLAQRIEEVLIRRAMKGRLEGYTLETSREIAGLVQSEAAVGAHVGAETALQVATMALNDWLHVYADDMCREEDVAAAKARIRAQGGTLCYITNALDAIRAAQAVGADVGAGEPDRTLAHRYSKVLPGD